MQGECNTAETEGGGLRAGGGGKAIAPPRPPAHNTAPQTMAIYERHSMIQVNAYFEGNVKSLSLDDNGRRATLGVMAPGEYEFGTSQHETIHVVVGTIEVKLPGEESFKAYSKGDVFEAPANIKFQVKMSVPVGYLCYYD